MFLFPVIFGCLVVSLWVWFVRELTLSSFLLAGLITYLLPPVLFRVYRLFFPNQTGKWMLSQPKHCPWWIAHQFQVFYAVCPFFESVLRLIPGGYSTWLSLWGSRIGKRIYWTPCVELLDRHLLEIGDDVIFGHRAVVTSHIVVKKPNSELVLVAKTPVIGNGAFVGACSRIGPGVKIPDGVVVPYNSEHRFSYEP